MVWYRVWWISAGLGDLKPLLGMHIQAGMNMCLPPENVKKVSGKSGKMVLPSYIDIIDSKGRFLNLHELPIQGMKMSRGDMGKWAKKFPPHSGAVLSSGIRPRRSADFSRKTTRPSRESYNLRSAWSEVPQFPLQEPWPNPGHTPLPKQEVFSCPTPTGAEPPQKNHENGVPPRFFLEIAYIIAALHGFNMF